MSAVDAHQRDFRINVLSDAVAGSSDQAHDDVVVTADEAFSWLRHRVTV